MKSERHSQSISHLLEGIFSLVEKTEHNSFRKLALGVVLFVHLEDLFERSSVNMTGAFELRNTGVSV